MDNEKLNERELNTPEEIDSADDTPITADDLFARLKMHLKEAEEKEAVAESADEEFKPAEEAEDIPAAVEEEISPEELFFGQRRPRGEQLSLEDVAEPVEEEKVEKRSTLTDSVKRLIAELKTDGENAEQPEKAAEEAFEFIQAMEEETSAEKQPAEEAPEILPDKEYSVLIENSSDKTNVFDPKALKKPKKFGETEKLFEENEQSGVVEAEQLTFSMTEEDVQQSIKEAEAFIFEREYVESPEDIIDEPVVAAEETAAEDASRKEGEYDQTDLWIASAFGDEDELKNMYGEEEAQRIETQLDIDVREYLNDERKQIKTARIAEEFTSASQKKEIFAAYRKEHKLSLVKLAGCFIVMLIALIFENIVAFGGTLPGALNQQNYPVVYILASLQLLIIAGAIAWKEIYRGIRAILAMRPLPESITAVVAISSALYHIAHCFISETDPRVALYVFPAILCIFVSLVYDFFSLKREIYSFNITASKRIKYTINHIDSENAGLENEAFGEYLGGDQEIAMFKIGKTGFVNGFKKRMNAYPKSNSIVTLLISVAIALGLVFFIVATVVYDVKAAFSFGYLAYILALPFCSLLAFAYPMYRASKKAFGDGSAIIGEASLDEYAHANTLSFDDKDVFPSYGVRVKSIKVYGENGIDGILYNAASIFKVIGGPLADVFDTATRELGSSDDPEIIEIAKDGIEALVDGNHVYLGKTAYVKANGFTPIAEPEDEALETNGEASIMYMICDDKVAAKMYVQYTIDPDFEYALKRLYKAGICIGIKTFDPNVDDKLLGSKVNISKYPVRILRCSSLEEATVTQDEADSGVISKSGPRALLNTFVLCSKVLFANRTNNLIKILAIAASVFLMASLLVFGKVVSIPSLYVALYQLFWMVPVFIFSKLYV